MVIIFNHISNCNDFYFQRSIHMIRVAKQTRLAPVNHLLFYCVKQPGIYLLMITGIMLEFIIQLPFIVICTLERLFHKRTD